MGNINAGCIVVTKFVQSGDRVFSGYINYIARESAVRNEHTDKFSTYSDYMGRPEATTELFTDGKNHLTYEEKLKLKNVYETAQENGSLMWQTVISFDNDWLAQNGIYDEETGHVDDIKLREYTRASINTMLKKEGLEHAVWSGAIHYNTDNIHIHVATVEPVPMRQTMVIDGETVYRGKFKLSSIQACKSKMVNGIMDNSVEIKRINALTRSIILEDLKRSPLWEQRYFVNQYMRIYNQLPRDRRQWKYGMNGIRKLRTELDQLTDSWMQRYHANDWQELKGLLENREDVYTEAYGQKAPNQYMANQLRDLHQRCGNIILKSMLELSRQDVEHPALLAGLQQAAEHVPLQEQEERDLFPETDENIAGIMNEEVNGSDASLPLQEQEDFYLVPALPMENLSENKEAFLDPEEVESALDSNDISVAWTKEYKAARQNLYATKERKPDFPKAAKLLLDEAQRGNAFAFFDLGSMHEKGLGMEIDETQAYAFYEKALEGFEQALRQPDCEMKSYLQYRIGKMYLRGQGTSQDYEAAVSSLEASGSQYAQYTLANLYRFGEGVEQDESKAYALYSEAAKEIPLGEDRTRPGIPFAMNALGQMTERGLGTEADAQKAYEWYEKALPLFQSINADNPDDKMQYRLGKMFQEGKGTETDIKVAKEYYTQAAQAGNADAQYALAKLAIDNVVEVSHEELQEAVEWLEKSANEGNNSKAQYQLAKLHLNGTGVQRNTKKAETYLQAAVEQNNQYAQYTLGKLYYDGEQLPEDKEQGLNLLEASAAQGNDFANFALGRHYLDHTDQYSEGLRYLQTAAEGQHSASIYRLAKEDLSGEHVKKDVSKAMEYLNQAIDQENPFAEYYYGCLLIDGQEIDQNVFRGQALLEAAAEKDNYYAMHRLAKEYLSGEHFEKDTGRAIGYLEQAMKLENSMAYYTMGCLLIDGKETDQDISRGKDLLEDAAGKDNSFAMNRLAKEYLSGKHFEKDTGRALDYLEQAMKLENPMAYYTVGCLLIEGKEVNQDIARGEVLLTASANQENEFAQCKLGHMYIRGDILTQDIDAGLSLLNKACNQGNALAQYRLGKLYYDSDIISQDIQHGIQLLEQSAKQDNSYAQYVLGRHYLEVPGEFYTGLIYLEQAADLDHSFAQYTLGSIYLNGDRIEQDIDRGLQLLERSAALSNDFSMHRLGMTYLKGEGVQMNTEKAAAYLTEASDLGNQYAQYQLGKAYLAGTFGYRDEVRGLAYLSASADQGNEFAQHLLNRRALGLTEMSGSRSYLHDPGVGVAIKRVFDSLNNERESQKNQRIYMQLQQQIEKKSDEMDIE